MEILKNKFFQKSISFLLSIIMIYGIIIPTNTHASSLGEQIKTMTIQEIKELDIKIIENAAISELKKAGFNNSEIEEIIELCPITKDNLFGELDLNDINDVPLYSTFAYNGEIKETPVKVTIHDANAFGYVAPGIGWGLSKTQWAALITTKIGWGIVIAGGVVAGAAIFLAYRYLSEHEVVYLTFVQRYQFDEYEGFGKWYLVDIRVS